MKKEKQFLKLNIQHFASGTPIKSEDLGKVRNIDFVNRFNRSIEELLSVLGTTRRLPLTSDGVIKTYKWESNLQDGDVAEGELIPLSTATRKPDKEYRVPFKKHRKQTTLEAIHAHGAARAVNETDNEILNDIQDEVTESFFTFLNGTSTVQKAETFQAALSYGWAKTKEIFKGKTKGGIVTFVSPMDVAEYLATAEIKTGASSEYGFTILTNFVGQTVIVYDSLPAGAIYTTVVDNIVLANHDVSSSEMAREFNLSTDETGLIGVTHSTRTDNATKETLVVHGTLLFAEMPDGVVKTEIEAAPETLPEG